MGPKIELSAADGGSHDRWRAEPSGAVKGARRTLPINLHPAITGAIAAPAVCRSHAKLALRRKLDYFKQHVG
jgi:hypothetical protein